MIFNVSEPGHREVGQVRQMILRGALRGSRKGQWSTSQEAVAEYLTARSLKRGSGAGRATATARLAANDDAQAPAGPASYGGRDLRPVYRDIFKDYFLTVIRRRDAKHDSQAFQRAVFAGQALSLVALVVCGWFVYRSTLSPPPPAELAVVEQWLEKNTQRYRILGWSPVQRSGDGGGAIRVKYQYQERGARLISTERLFVVANGRVTDVSNADL